MTQPSIEGRDARAEEARMAVLAMIRKAKNLTVAEFTAGRNFATDDAAAATVTITISLRQAFSLVRVLGPIGLQNGDGSFTRLFAAMHICQRQLLRARDGKSLGVVAALQVLQAAINDHLWHCRDVADPPAAIPRQPRGARRASRLKPRVERGVADFP
jgi:hypothetical protein